MKAETLFAKIIEELKQPKQLLNPERAFQLTNNAIAALRGALHTGECYDFDVLDRLNAASLITYEYPGCILFKSELPIFGMLFSPQTSFMWKQPFNDSYPPRVNPDYLIVGPTVNHYEYRLPELGYRQGNITRVPFAKAASEDEIQHGGILIDNRKQTLTILNYNDMLLNVFAKPSDNHHHTIAANWYVDHNSAYSVASRPNMRELRPYNAIGQFIVDNQPLTFTLNRIRIEKIWPPSAKLSMPSRFCSLAELISLTKVIAHQIQATEWKLAGLEYFGGGTFGGDDELYRNMHTAILAYNNRPS